MKLNVRRRSRFYRKFDKFSSKVTRLTGSSYAFLSAVGVIALWVITGPLFQFSDTWQLVINTGTTIVTFLMVFLIQQSANKETMAIQLKLNELIACNEKSSNRLIDVEDLTEEELLVIKKFYIRLSRLSRLEGSDLFSTHSIDEARLKSDVKEQNAAPIPLKKYVN